MTGGIHGFKVVDVIGEGFQVETVVAWINGGDGIRGAWVLEDVVGRGGLKK